jgi:ankyrin repeat protein
MTSTTKRFFESEDRQGLLKYIEANDLDDVLRESLFHALWKDWDDVAAVLIERGADLYVKAAGGTPIRDVIRKSKHELLRQMIAKGFDVNHHYLLSRPLELALEAQNYVAGEVLLNAGAALSEGHELSTLLNEVYRQRPDGVSLVLRAGVSPNHFGALHPALVSQSEFAPKVPEAIFESLDDAAFDIQKFDMRKLQEQVEALQAQKIEARRKGESIAQQLTDVTPLMVAAYTGNEQIVDLLLSHGASTELLNEEGRSAIDFLGSNSSPALRKKLEFDSSSALLKRKQHFEVFSEAESGNTSSVKAQFDILGDADVRDVRKGRSGQTLLHIAARTENGSLADFLLGKGADIHRVDEVNTSADPELKRVNGRTALMYAAHAGSTAVFNQLIAHGANVNAHDSRGETPLMIALAEGHYDLADQMLDVGAYSSVVRHDGHTPLSLALARDEAPPVRLVKRLIDNGAPKARLNGSSKSLVARALAYKDIALLDVLVTAGHRLAAAEVKFKNIRAELERLDTQGSNFIALLDEPDDGWKKYKLPRANKKLSEAWDPAQVRKRLQAAAAKAPVAAMLKLLRDQFATNPIDELHTRGGWRVPLDQRKGPTLEQIRSLLSQEFMAIGAENINDSTASHAFIAVTSKELELVAALEPNAANYDIETVRLLAGLEELSRLTEIHFTFASYDTVCGTFIGPIRHLWEVGELLYAICPEVCEEGRAGLPRYMSDLTKTRSFFLWWD